jgi:hypothetical protein
MGHDFSPFGMQPFIAVGVIKMPMRIDKMFDRILTEAGQRFGD